MIRKEFMLMLFTSLLLSGLGFAQNNDPVIDTVFVQQQEGSFLVDIYYDVTDLDGDPLIIYVKVSNDSGKTFNVPAKTFYGDDYGFNVIPGQDKHFVWDAGKDYSEQYGENFQAKLIASDLKLGQTVTIPLGTFSMGDSAGSFNQLPRHDVTLTEYYITPYVVTNAEYKIFCDMTSHPYPPEGGNNQSPQGYFTDYLDYPVVGVSWYDAVKYCNWLSMQHGYSTCYDTIDWNFDPTKNGYHLPTEAQWERAARGGLEKMKYPWGNEDPGNRCNYQSYQGPLTSEMANFSNGRGTLAVGKFQPNGLGLYDMAGNVWEWCNDWYQEDYYSQSPPTNPYGPNTGSEKVVRGGAWNATEFYLGCAARYSKSQNTKRYDIGFRIAR